MFYKEITESRANEVARRFGFLSTLLHNQLRRITMTKDAVIFAILNIIGLILLILPFLPKE